MNLHRRQFLYGTSILALAGPVFSSIPASAAVAAGAVMVEPVPLAHVSLAPSIFADAVKANRAYLASLDPERLLHNFYLSAGLEPKGEVYGGWEALGIAGHSMGHWLSGVSLIIANTGDAELGAKLDHALAEMARIQAAQGDGYLAGGTVDRDGETVDGKIVFEEVRRGQIDSNGFGLNGGWVPLYSYHKIHAGLIDAYRLAGRKAALPIMLGVADYLAGVLEPLDDEQMQQVLHAEHGGLNETYAETYALTGDPRWLAMARKIYHKAVLDPLVAQEDRLEGLHANTQIPKVIGLARIHEVGGDEKAAVASRFFHDRVVNHHSYVIGGNSEREHFGKPDQRAHRLGEATCEACNSYNMMKLTRHLYGWQPEAAWFDYYERVQLNHIMAHQRPDDGRFVYFMPLAPGVKRTYSEPENSFWCCVGSGMESHAKHADSIWWHDASANELYLNLYIPSQLDWPERGLGWRLDTAMPKEGSARLEATRASTGPTTLALRLPGWTQGASVSLNGEPVLFEEERGYARITRRWAKGDTVELTLPMAVEVHHVPDDPSIVAFTRGPLVLAADMGPAQDPSDGPGPVLVSDGSITPAILGGSLATRGGMGEELRFVPFFEQYDRRVAVYLPSFSSAEWQGKRGEYLQAQEAARELTRRTVDMVYLGEMQPERDHQFQGDTSEVVNWNGRQARRLPPGETMELTLKRRPGDAILRVTVFGDDASKPFALAVDGQPLEAEWPERPEGQGFLALDFPLPSAGEQGRDRATIAVTALKDQALIYDMRMMTLPQDTVPAT